MKLKILFCIIMLAGSFCACQKEEELAPSRTPNPFAPLPGATDEESKLREEFYKNTGCHLLFNDTLRHEYRGLDENGQPFYETELLGIEWEMTAMKSSRFRFEYLQSQEQKSRVVRFLQTQLLGYMKNVLPYSILAVNRIDEYSSDYGSYEYAGSPLTCSNLQCLAMDVNRLWELTEEEEKTFAQDLCCEMIFASWGGSSWYSYTDGKAKEFFTINQYDYGQKKEYKDYYGNPLKRVPLEIGFLEDPYESTVPSAKEDAIAYIKACLSMTEEEFWAKYGGNDIKGNTRRKYNAIKPLLEASGIKFN